jgi:hypothetical protein
MLDNPQVRVLTVQSEPPQVERADVGRKTRVRWDQHFHGRNAAVLRLNQRRQFKTETRKLISTAREQAPGVEGRDL